jgi:hypothetical protein
MYLREDPEGIRAAELPSVVWSEFPILRVDAPRYAYNLEICQNGNVQNKVGKAIYT